MSWLTYMFLASPPFLSTWKSCYLCVKQLQPAKAQICNKLPETNVGVIFNLLQPGNSSHIKQVKDPPPRTWRKHLKELTSLCCKWFDSKTDDQGLRSNDQSNTGSRQPGMWEWWQMISSLFVSSWILHLKTEPPQQRTKLLMWRLPRVIWCTFLRARSGRFDWCKTRTLHFSLTRTARAAFCFHLASFSQRMEIWD